jgi:hypothetical protein
MEMLHLELESAGGLFSSQFHGFTVKRGVGYLQGREQGSGIRKSPGLW